MNDEKEFAQRWVRSIHFFLQYKNKYETRFFAMLSKFLFYMTVDTMYDCMYSMSINFIYICIYIYMKVGINFCFFLSIHSNLILCLIKNIFSYIIVWVLSIFYTSFFVFHLLVGKFMYLQVFIYFFFNLHHRKFLRFHARFH